MDHFFGLADVPAIIAALESASEHAWAQSMAALLRKRSPLMLHVVLEQIRRARGMTLAQDLRMERDLVRHCFYLRPGKVKRWRASAPWPWTKTTNPAGNLRVLRM